jgi:hypothetical protein
LFIGIGINLTTLSITEEVVQGIITTLPVVICCMLTKITSMGDRIVYWTIWWWLLGRVVSVVGLMMGVSIVRLVSRVHLGAVVIIALPGSFTTALSVAVLGTAVLFWGSEEDGIICVSLHMFLQILRSLEGLPTEIALVRLQGNVDSDMGCDMIALDGSGTARIPSTREVQVICALPSDMFFADVLKESFCRCALLRALVPLTR